MTPLRIMVADDEEVIRLFMGRILQDLGHTCDFAVDGRDCLNKFAAAGGGYDILFLDLIMPRLDGDAVLRQIRAHYPSTIVVMASVQDDEEAIKELLAEGATAYLTKPIRAPEIERVMQKLTELRAKSRKN